MFSQTTIWSMNHPDGKADTLHCEACDYPMIGFWLVDDHKVCEICKFQAEVGTCENCGTFGTGATSWGGWCHDCDNSMS